MKFLLMICRDEAVFGDGRSSGEHSKPNVNFARAMSEAGILVAGYQLQPSATPVRANGGRTEVSEGHYSDAPEQLGGFYVIDVAGTEEAVRWAARCPAGRHRDTADLGIILGGGPVSQRCRGVPIAAAEVPASAPAQFLNLLAIVKSKFRFL
jgi:hypothetical protein